MSARLNNVGDQHCAKSRSLPQGSRTEVTFGVSFHASASRMCVDRPTLCFFLFGAWALV